MTLGFFKLLVVGGFNGGGISNSAEAYDLEVPGNTCAPMPSVPVAGFEGQKGGLTFNQKPIVCGGHWYYSTERDTCWTLEGSAWKLAPFR